MNSWDTENAPLPLPLGKVASYTSPFLAIVSLCLIFFWFYGAATPLVTIIATAMFAGWLTEDERSAAALADSGAFFVVAWLTWSRLDSIVSTLPAYAHRDIPISIVYNTVIDNTLTNPLLGLGR